MPVLMLMLITVLNDGTLIAIGYDRVSAPRTPVKWNLPAIFTISSVLAGVACASSLFLLYILLDSWRSNGIMQTLGIGGIYYGQVTTCIYLKVAVSDFLTLFSSRTGGDWFWSTAPAPLLMGAGAFAISCSLTIALSWPSSFPDGIETLGLGRREPYALFVWILIYCLVWWFIQDAAKVYAYYLLKKFNVFKVNETGQVKLEKGGKHIELLVLEDQDHAH